MKKLFKLALIGLAGTFLPMMASAQDVMTIVNSRVGVGESVPNATMEVVGTAATVGTGNAVILLRKEGGLAFQVDNTAATAPGFWNFSAALNDAEFRINSSDFPGVTMKLNKNGNMTILGQLVTGGPECGIATPCDGVFNEDFELMSIEEHGQKMFANKHLPAVGPTQANRPVNISEQYGKMLNELEHAHIYIQQLNGEKQELHRKVDTLESRLSELEALLSR